MDLSKAFNTTQYAATNKSPFVLDLYIETRGGSVYNSFDFLTRSMYTRTGSSEGGVTVTPFAQLDREVLVAMRDKLVELGGTPPDLAPEAPTLNKAQRGLNP